MLYTTKNTPKILPIPALVLAAFFASTSMVFRFIFEYPICHNDEHNWLTITESLDRGIDWPVSGPAFIAMLRETSRFLGVNYANAMPWLGVSSSFIVVCGLFFGYRVLGLASQLPIFLVLMLSSYFWAPLLEARPQQLGQLLVFWGAISSWLWLQRREGGWVFFLIIVCIAFTHILSHAILVLLCTTLVFADWMQKRLGNHRHLAAILCIALSLGVYIWPAGPYEFMLTDLRDAHFKKLHLIHLATLAATVATGFYTFKFIFYRLSRDKTNAIVDFLNNHLKLFTCSLVLVLIFLLTIQAYILPAQAWLPYQGSWPRFIVYQIGNITFATFSL